MSLAVYDHIGKFSFIPINQDLFNQLKQQIHLFENLELLDIKLTTNEDMASIDDIIDILPGTTKAVHVSIRRAQETSVQKVLPLEIKRKDHIERLNLSAAIHNSKALLYVAYKSPKLESLWLIQIVSFLY